MKDDAYCLRLKTLLQPPFIHNNNKKRSQLFDVSNKPTVRSVKRFIKNTRAVRYLSALIVLFFLFATAGKSEKNKHIFLKSFHIAVVPVTSKKFHPTNSPDFYSSNTILEIKSSFCRSSHITKRKISFCVTVG